MTRISKRHLRLSSNGECVSWSMTMTTAFRRNNKNRVVAIIVCVVTTLLFFGAGVVVVIIQYKHQGIITIGTTTTTPNTNTNTNNSTNLRRDSATSTIASTVLSSETEIETERNWIWSRMNPEEQQQALQDTLPYLQSFIHLLNQTKRDRWVSQQRCPIVLFGTQWGTHQLCDITAMTVSSQSCNFISFGIHRDYSFDTDLAQRWDCRGFAADPTVVHPSQLHPLVTFHSIAATTLHPNMEQRQAAAQQQSQHWWTTSMPGVKKFLGLDNITVLKMDCEGCEYSLSRDILSQDPLFFHSVQQFTFEVHLNTIWMNDTETLYYYAQLFRLLHQAGLSAMGTSIGGCGWDNEAYPPFPALVEMGYPGQQGETRVRQRRSCHEYLFARYDGVDCTGCSVKTVSGGNSTNQTESVSIPTMDMLDQIVEIMKAQEKEKETQKARKKG